MGSEVDVIQIGSVHENPDGFRRPWITDARILDIGVPQIIAICIGRVAESNSEADNVAGLPVDEDIHLFIAVVEDDVRVMVRDATVMVAAEIVEPVRSRTARQRIRAATTIEEVVASTTGNDVLTQALIDNIMPRVTGERVVYYRTKNARQNRSAPTV